MLNSMYSRCVHPNEMNSNAMILLGFSYYTPSTSMEVIEIMIYSPLKVCQPRVQPIGTRSPPHPQISLSLPLSLFLPLPPLISSTFSFQLKLSFNERCTFFFCSTPTNSFDTFYCQHLSYSFQAIHILKNLFHRFSQTLSDQASERERK